MPRVLFVCLGNICRSPTAEAVFRVLVPEVEADSAGTGDWHVGKPPYPPAIRVAEARGFPMADLRARTIDVSDFDAFDLIVVMDRQNLKDVEALRPAGNTTPVRLMLDYLPDAPVTEVPDPYYTGDFDEALDLITGAARHLGAALRSSSAD